MEDYCPARCGDVLKKNCQNIPIDGQALTRMKNLRILKKCFPKVEGRWQPFEVNFSGRLDLLSNKLRLLYWHGCPFKYLPSNFYPENIVAIDLCYSHIKQLWTTPKIDFSEITNLEELDLEGCVNLVSVHPSIGMLKRLPVLNLRDSKRLQNFAGRVETDAITQLPSFVSSLINLESLSFGGQGRIQPRWWTSITAPFGLLSKQQHPQRSVSLEGLHMLKKLKLSYRNLEQVPKSIGGLSCLKELYLNGNNFTSLPGSLSQLSHLRHLRHDGCKKLEVLPELPPSLRVNASDCTSLREVSGSSKDPFKYGIKGFRNCPKLFKNVTIDSEVSISKTQCLDSAITSQGFIHQLWVSRLRDVNSSCKTDFIL